MRSLAIDDTDVNGNLFKGLTQGEWYWRVASGKYTESTFNRLLRFHHLFDAEPNDTGIASLFVGKEITNRFLNLPIEGFVAAGFARHFENGHQDNFNEYILGFKAYYSNFPWSHVVNTRVGIAEGISYSARVSSFEKRHIGEKNGLTSHLLNYLSWSWDFSIGDIIRV